MKRMFLIIIVLAQAVAVSAQNITESRYDGFNLVRQAKGMTLGYSPQSGVKVIYSDGYAFRI